MRTSTRGARALWLASSVAVMACSSPQEPSTPPSTAEPGHPPTTTEPATTEPGTTEPGTTEREVPATSEAPEPGAGDPLADLAAPVRDDEVVEARVSTLTTPALEPGVCAEVADAPVRVLPDSSPMAIVAAHDRFFLAGYEPTDAGEQLSVVELVAGQAPRLVVSIPIPGSRVTRTAPPALALVGNPGAETQELGVAYLDGDGAVWAAFFDPTRPSPRPLGLQLGPADLRFAPALARVGDVRVVAATIPIPENGAAGQPTRIAMRMHLRRLDASGAILGSHDVTPLAGGGSHPVFSGAPSRRPDLFFVDARVALSVIHRVTLDAQGSPGETTVARPINLSAEPPSIAVVRAGGRELAAYAAVGNMATRAVGIVELGATEAPDGLVPGLGYGQPLTVRGISRDTDAVFASEAPSAVAADAPHEVRVRTARVASDGHRTLGPALVLAGAVRPALAADDAGVVAVALEGGLVRFVRCGPP